MYTLGDANRDGMIDARDAAAVLTNYAYMSVGIVPEKAVLLASDVDGDGMADGRDATLILTYYSKASAGKAGGFEDFISRR